MHICAWQIAGIVALCPVHACGDGGTGVPDLDISGDWAFSEAVFDEAREFSCNNGGTFTFDQEGSRFTGTNNQVGTCTIGEDTFENSGRFIVINGSVVGMTVMFRTPEGTPCDYVGSLSGDPPIAASGTVSCVGTNRGQPLNATGTWQMTR